MRFVFCQVLVDGRGEFGNDGLTYAVGEYQVELGMWVLVPFRNQAVPGVVIALLETTATAGIKPIQGVLDVPPLPRYAVTTLGVLAQYTRSSPRAILNLWLAPGHWKFLCTPAEPAYLPVPGVVVSPAAKKQLAVFEALTARAKTKTELTAELGSITAPLKALLESQKIQVVKAQPLSALAPALHPPVLSAVQTGAYQQLAASTSSLLFGVTGSGKTEIYATLIADAIRTGKQAIYLAPEILVAESVVERFTTLLPAEHIAVIHSKLTPAQKRELWLKIRSGSIWLVIGSRSALFSPLPNLGLIVVDEEHEWTYKNEQEPRYHVHRAATEIAAQASAKLVFGTATPSLSLWSQARSGALTLVTLPERYSSIAKPSVEVIDLTEVEFQDHYPFSPRLAQALQENFTSGQQAVLFLNRRGHGSAVLCLDCRRRLVSPTTGLPFSVHQRGTQFQLYDLVSELYFPIPDRCPHCQSVRLHVIGAGTQKVEAILHRILPQARVARADSDVLETAADMLGLLKDLRDRKVDVLIGTQMVAKGLDLPGVALAAVVLADTGLSIPHFRSGERTMQLLTQLVGRSGRHQPGHVIIQTYRPDATEVCTAQTGLVTEYLDQELRMRTQLRFPPATELVAVRFRGADSERMARQALAEIQAVDLKKSLVGYVNRLTRSAEMVWQLVLRGPNATESIPEKYLSLGFFDPDPLELL